MGHHVDQEIAQSQRGPDLQTKAARQAHHIKWAGIFGIPDLCGYYKGFIRIMAIYIKYVQCGVNYNNKQVLLPRWSITSSNSEASVHRLVCPT
jgi:hypothetical protein